jgi:hypothetical protein
MSERNYVPVVITTPAASAEAMNQLIAATGAEGATDKSLGAPVWDESTPIVLGADGWPNMAAMPPPEFLVSEGLLHVDAASKLPEDEPGTGE